MYNVCAYVYTYAFFYFPFSLFIGNTFPFDVSYCSLLNKCIENLNALVTYLSFAKICSYKKKVTSNPE